MTWHALCVRPDIRFKGQENDEEVLLTMRAHPITLLSILFNALILFMFIFIGNFFIVPFLKVSQVIYIDIFFLFIIFLYIWIGIINWYFNMGIVTNQEVVETEFSVIGTKKITRTELPHIEDITAKSGGFIPGIFDYGNIFLQTAGTLINTEFVNSPHPGEAAHIIQEILQEYGNLK